MKHLLSVLIFSLMLVACSSILDPLTIVGNQNENESMESSTPRSTITVQNVSTPSLSPTPAYHCRFGVQDSQTSVEGLTIHLPILMYHQIKDLSGISQPKVNSISASPKELDRQMEYLILNGYQTIYFTDLLDYLQKKCLLPENPIILTFDDGWVEDYTVVFPTLKKYGMVGTFFPPTNWVNHGATGLISWDQISQMSAEGMEFGSHTVSHAWLDPLSKDQARNELALSKQLLEEHTGNPIIVLAYPGGSFSGQVIELAKEEGYQAAVTTLYGTDQDLSKIFILHRMSVYYYESLTIFASRLK